MSDDEFMDGVVFAFVLIFMAFAVMSGVTIAARALSGHDIIPQLHPSPDAALRHNG